MNCGCHLLGLSHLLLYPVVVRACRRTLTMMAPTISVVGGGRLCACATSVAPACRPRATAMRAAATGARRPLPCLHFLLLCLCLLQQVYTSSSSSQRVGGGRGPCWQSRVILISLVLRYPILHAPMFCHLPQGFQYCFCFCYTTFPSHVGTFFQLQWEFQWENVQNK